MGRRLAQVAAPARAADKTAIRIGYATARD